MSIRITLKSVGLSIPIELIIQNKELSFMKILELLYDYYEYLKTEELIFSLDKTGTQRISLNTKVKDLKIVDEGSIYFFLKQYLENQKDQEFSNLQNDKMNEISIYLEAVGFTWPRDDPKLIFLVPRKDNNFEEILQFLQEEENIDQEIVFSQDKTGTQRIINLKTTLKALKIANNGTIYVLLKQNIDKEPPQPEKKPIQQIQINNMSQKQNPPQYSNEQQNELIVSIQLNVQVKVKYGQTIQEIIDQFLLEAPKNNWQQNAILKEDNGQAISSDPKHILQEPQIRKNVRYILSIDTNNIYQQDQSVNLKQEILQVREVSQVQQSEKDIENLKQLVNKEQNENKSLQNIKEQLSLIQDTSNQQQQVKQNQQKSAVNDIQSFSSSDFDTLTNIQIEDQVFQQQESSDQDQYQSIQNEVNQMKTEWEQQILELKQKLDEVISNDQQQKLKKIEQIENKLQRLKEENQVLRNQKLKQLDNKEVVQLNEIEILSDSLGAQDQQNKVRKDLNEISYQNSKLK